MSVYIGQHGDDYFSCIHICVDPEMQAGDEGSFDHYEAKIMRSVVLTLP